MIKFDTSHAHLQENIFDYQQAKMFTVKPS